MVVSQNQVEIKGLKEYNLLINLPSYPFSENDFNGCSVAHLKNIKMQVQPRRILCLGRIVKFFFLNNSDWRFIGNKLQKSFSTNSINHFELNPLTESNRKIWPKKISHETKLHSFYLQNSTNSETCIVFTSSHGKNKYEIFNLRKIVFFSLLLSVILLMIL